MTTQGIFDQFKSELPVTGTSKINHGIRVKLGITADEYCFMLFLEELVQRGEVFDLPLCYQQTGFREDVARILYDSLIGHGMIFPFKPGENPAIANKWKHAFLFKGEFEQFWFVETPNGKRAIWPGSKSKTERLFHNIRKHYSLQYLLDQREYYLKFLQLTKKYRNFDRAIMGGPVFLGPDKNFEQDWKSQCEEIEKQYNPQKTMVEAASPEQIKKAFS